MSESDPRRLWDLVQRRNLLAALAATQSLIAGAATGDRRRWIKHERALSDAQESGKPVRPMSDTQAADAVHNSLKRRYLYEALQATEELIALSESKVERRRWLAQSHRLRDEIWAVQARFLT